MDKIKKIIIHCSDSHTGSVELINAWHLSNGWDGIGYHYVIENGYPFSSKSYVENRDGIVAKGRSENKQGAHCLGQNENSLGICLIGRRTFTYRQLFICLPTLIYRLISTYELTINDIYGHYEFDNKKTCPNIDMLNYRDFLKYVYFPNAQQENLT